MRLKSALALAAICAGVLASSGIANSQDDPIAARQALMKANGAAAKVAVDFIRGTNPYDATAAAAAMAKIKEDMTTFVTLFPPGSDKGGDTTASPKIWEDQAGFKAQVDKMIADATAAEAAAGQGLDAFKAAFAVVGGNCQSCHQTYRIAN